MMSRTGQMSVSSDHIDHNHIISTVAKKHLGELGLLRRGKSRVWYKDNGWWASLVEFQASDRGRGTYLNVGVTWLWHSRGHFSFDQGGRIEPFTRVDDESTFFEEMEKLAAKAAAEVHRAQQQFRTIDAVAAHLARQTRTSIWDHFHVGVSAGLVGNQSFSRSEFEKVISASADAPWVTALQRKAEGLCAAAASQDDFNILVADEIGNARRLLKFPAIDNPFAPPDLS